METSPPSSARPFAARWRTLSSRNRRRIVLGSLFALALAGRDLMLFLVASGLFALSELGAAPRPAPVAA